MEIFFLVVGSIFGLIVLIVAGFIILIFLNASIKALGNFRIFILASLYRSNKVKFMELMSKNHHHGHLLKYASEKLKSDYEVAIFALRISKGNFLRTPIEHVGEKLKRDPNFMLEAVNLYGENYEAAEFSIRKHNIQLLKSAISTKPGMLAYAPWEFRDNENVLLSSLETECGCWSNNYRLEFASDRIKKNKEIVSQIVKNCPCSLQFVLDNLNDDEELVFEAVSQKGRALEFASERLKDDFEIVKAAVTNDGSALRFASERLRDSYDIVVIADEKHWDAFQYASPRLKQRLKTIWKIK
jgi:hypothetical protein